MKYRAGIIRRAKHRCRRLKEEKGMVIRLAAMKKNVTDALKMMWQLDRVVGIVSVLRAIIEGALPFIGIYLSAYILDGLQRGTDGRTLFYTAFIAVALVFALTVLDSYLEKIFALHAYSCSQKFEMQLGRRTLDMDYELLESPRVNEIRTRIHSDHNWGSGFYSVIWDFHQVISSIAGLGISIGIMTPLLLESNIFSEPFVLLLIFAFVGTIVFSTRYLSGKQKSINKVMDQAAQMRTYEEYFLTRRAEYREGKDIRTYRAQRLIEDYLGKNDGQINIWMKELTSDGCRSGFMNGFSMGLLQTLAYLFVVFRAVSGALTIGLVLKYAATIYRFSTSLLTACSTVSEFAVSARRQQSMLDYQNVESVLYKGSLPVEKRFFCEERDNDYEVEFRNVSFRYPGSEQYALWNFSFRFKKGGRLAVVGRNGSGKTTFIKLLCRLYDPDEGEILLNGINIKKYDYEEYQSIFSVVFQDFKIFSFSIAENVAASLTYDENRVNACLVKAGFGERLLEMPEGAHTFLYHHFDTDGVEISGGEAQKIALARALYKDAPFIILDEPTAALDPIAEYDVYSRFNEIIENKTAVYISHRLSSCRFCDDIAVFDKGRLVQRGSHEQLLAEKNGKYYELWQAQAQYYEGKDVEGN
ncbi:MAG: ABC transporter ATP-binding protein/permease [Ruminococcus sp.]|nr:ABC transporter ATP-binding protein/permease [Ruminococcus sp.]